MSQGGRPLSQPPNPVGGAVLELELGDVLELRKLHPCGSRSWAVVRLGADIGLTCAGCGRRVLLERRELERRILSVHRATASESASESDS